MTRILVGLGLSLTLFALASVKGTARVPFTATLIAHTAAVSADTTSVTTSDIVTSGANLIVVCVHSYVNDPTLSDSKSNSPYSGLTVQDNGTHIKIYYFYAPTVGSGHNFTLTGSTSYPSITVLAFSGAVTSPFDQQNGSEDNNVSTLATGSVTPSEDNEILVACATTSVQDTSSVNASFTLLDHSAVTPALAIGYASAYQFQTAATARNPTFTFAGSEPSPVAAIATFKATGGTSSFVQGILNNPVRGGGQRR